MMYAIFNQKSYFVGWEQDEEVAKRRADILAGTYKTWDSAERKEEVQISINKDIYMLRSKSREVGECHFCKGDPKTGLDDTVFGVSPTTKGPLLIFCALHEGRLLYRLLIDYMKRKKGRTPLSGYVGPLPTEERALRDETP